MISSVIHREFYERCQAYESKRVKRFCQEFSSVVTKISGHAQTKDELVFIDQELIKPSHSQGQCKFLKHGQFRSKDIVDAVNAAVYQHLEVVYSFYFTQDSNKKHMLLRNFEKEKKKLILVRTKAVACDLYKFLTESMIKCEILTKNSSDEKRHQAIAAMNLEESSTLIMTDITLPGSIKNLQTIINYGAAKNITFQLRRLEKFGAAVDAAQQKRSMIMLMSESDAFLAPALVKILVAAKQPVPQRLLAMERVRIEAKINKKERYKKNFEN